PSLVLPHFDPLLAEPYSVTVSNDFGSTDSTNATLSVAQLVSWPGETYPLGTATDLVQVTIGNGGGAALRRDGTLAGWPNPGPPEFTNLVAIAAGLNHTLGLRKDGTVVGAGTSVP